MKVKSRNTWESIVKVRKYLGESFESQETNTCESVVKVRKYLGESFESQEIPGRVL